MSSNPSLVCLSRSLVLSLSLGSFPFLAACASTSVPEEPYYDPYAAAEGAAGIEVREGGSQYTVYGGRQYGRRHARLADARSPARGHVSFPVGVAFRDEDLGDARDLATIGLFDGDFRPYGSPLSFVVQTLIGINGNGPDDTPGSGFETADDTSVAQLNLGLRRVWGDEYFQPFVGGGISFVDVSVTEDDGHHHYYSHRDELDSDSDVAAWAGGGFYFTGGGPFHMGVAAQYLFDAEVELLGDRYDVGGWELMFLFGVGW